MAPSIPDLMLKACPSFGPALAESCERSGEEMIHAHATAFAIHLLNLHRSRRLDEYPAIAAFIEELFASEDPYVREFGSEGVFKSVQCAFGYANISTEAFYRFLHPLSATAWRSLEPYLRHVSPSICDDGGELSES